MILCPHRQQQREKFNVPTGLKESLLTFLCFIFKYLSILSWTEVPEVSAVFLCGGRKKRLQNLAQTFIKTCLKVNVQNLVK